MKKQVKTLLSISIVLSLMISVALNYYFAYRIKFFTSQTQTFVFADTEQQKERRAHLKSLNNYELAREYMKANGQMNMIHTDIKELSGFIMKYDFIDVRSDPTIQHRLESTIKEVMSEEFASVIEDWIIIYTEYVLNHYERKELILAIMEFEDDPMNKHMDIVDNLYNESSIEISERIDRWMEGIPDLVNSILYESDQFEKENNKVSL